MSDRIFFINVNNIIYKKDKHVQFLKIRTNLKTFITKRINLKIENKFYFKGQMF